jgi:hypothetical protein
MTDRTPTTEAGRTLAALMLDINEPGGYDLCDAILAIEAEAKAEARAPLQAALDDLIELQAAEIATWAKRVQEARAPLVAALREMVEHDAEMRDMCGDWGTDSCAYRSRAERALSQEEPTP